MEVDTAELRRKRNRRRGRRAGEKISGQRQQRRNGDTEACKHNPERPQEKQTTTHPPG